MSRSVAQRAAPHLFGIRHHGPGSARSLLQALNNLQPDVILIEGPPDANGIVHHLGHADMKPPVSMLVYAPDAPQYAAHYPFTTFSPEYQAIRYGLAHDLPVRFMDLPAAYTFRLLQNWREEQQSADDSPLTTLEGDDNDDNQPSPDEQLRNDPLGELAKAAGYQDGERWWEQMVEQRQDATGLFDAILEAMMALREAGVSSHHPREQQREAYMRYLLRQAMDAGFQRIAVVCGAWHTPALVNAHDYTDTDTAILTVLPDNPMRVEATFTPWTHSRLTLTSGYGAGIWSPGWYQHLWDYAADDIAVTWLTRVANLLRDEDLSASPAQVIDAVRLADTLAAIRERPAAGLEELNEATLTVLCFGDDAPLRLIHKKLIVGETMGAVPDDTPMVPLQRDLNRQQQQLGLNVSPDETTLVLDLREVVPLQRSHLLHRLEILGVQWGKKQEVTHIGGTYKEVWQLQWQPELTIQVIEKSAWGNTVYDAAQAYAHHAADTAPNLPTLTALVNDVLLADLPDVVAPVVQKLQAEAAVIGDIGQLMLALPPLADVLAYGNVRQTDADRVRDVVEGMVTRVCIGLPTECASLDDDAAAKMFRAVLNFQAALRLLDVDHFFALWHAVLNQLMTQQGVHGLLRGRACRILHDDGKIDIAETIRQMRLALSVADTTTQGKPEQVAAWLEGFLFASAIILTYDDRLLSMINDWVMALSNENFEALLPLLRRTFASFTAAERRQIGQRISRPYQADDETSAMHGTIDEARANRVLPTIAYLLGLELPDDEI